MAGFDADVFGVGQKADAGFDSDVFAFTAAPNVDFKPQPKKGNTAYEKGRNAEGELQGLINVMQGPTFGFADELIGAGGAAIGALRGRPIGESYREAPATCGGG